VVFSNDRQVTVQAPITGPASNEYFLYFNWQGLVVMHDETVRVQPVTPGVFAVDDRVAALNEDGSLHGPDNAAAVESIVQIFATGLGALNGTLALGDFAPLQTLLPTTAAVSVELDGADAPVLFAGAAPGQLGGVYQVNLRVPASMAPGEHRLTLRVAGQAAPSLRLWTR
jgi:uncharacterized protein (TIGR03437 family)